MSRLNAPSAASFFPFNKFAPPLSAGFVFEGYTTQRMIVLRVEYMKRMFDR